MYQIKNINKKIFCLLGSKYKNQFLFLIIQMIVGGLFEFFSLSLLIPYIGLIINKEKFFQFKIIQKIFFLLKIDTYNKLITIISISIIILFLFKNIFLYFLRINQVKFISHARNDISIKIMRNFLYKNYEFHLKHNSIELETVIINNIARTFVLIEKILSFIAESCLFICICCFLFYFNFIIMIGLTSLSFLVFISVKYIITPQILKNGKESNNCFKEMVKSIRESLHGIKEIKANQEEKFFLDIYKKIGTYNAEIDVKSIKWSDIVSRLLEFFLIFSICSIIIFVTVYYENAKKILEILIIISVYLIRLIPTINRLISYFNGIAYNIPAIMELDDEILDEVNNKTCTLKISKDINISKIELKNISFRYKDRKKYIFEKFNLSLFKGEIIGILGNSGVGKTTLINILLGFLIPTNGEILIDGKKSNGIIGNINVGYIPQNVFLLDDTIRNNITFGYQAEDDKIWKILEKVNLKTFVESLEKKLDTNIGENGIFLSGGQRQRLAIARALLRKIQVLILDEGTCNLDNVTEEDILNKIRNFKSDLFIIIISHHKNIYKFCDKLIELN